MERCRFSYVVKNIDCQYRETILQTNQLFIENKIINNNNNNSDNGNFERDNHGRSILAHDDCNNIAENNLNLDNESDDEHQQNYENNEYSDIPSDYYEEAIIDDNKSNCGGDVNDNDNYQPNEESHGFIIKDEIDIEETYLTIENNFEYEDQQINENNHHPNISIGDSNNETITNSDNHINDSGRYCSGIVEHRSSNKEFSSIIDTGSNKDQIIQKDNTYSNKTVNVDDNQKINDGNSDKNLVVNKQDCEGNHSKATGLECQKREKLKRKCKKILISNKSNLSTDLKKQTTDEHLQSNSSDKKFTRKVHLLAQNGEKTHQCNICDRKFTRKRDLKQHLLIHDDKKAHKCNTCNKIYTIKAHFKKHLLMHTGENLHHCNYCSKRFAWESHLKRHLLTHTDEKAHQCNSCNKKFASESLLKRHLLMHTGKKTHICNICDKAFTWKWYLKKHLLTHIGEKPHQCKICDMKLKME